MAGASYNSRENRGRAFRADWYLSFRSHFRRRVDDTCFFVVVEASVGKSGRTA